MKMMLMKGLHAGKEVEKSKHPSEGKKQDDLQQTSEAKCRSCVERRAIDEKLCVWSKFKKSTEKLTKRLAFDISWLGFVVLSITFSMLKVHCLFQIVRFFFCQFSRLYGFLKKEEKKNRRIWKFILFNLKLISCMCLPISLIRWFISLSV